MNPNNNGILQITHTFRPSKSTDVVDYCIKYVDTYNNGIWTYAWCSVLGLQLIFFIWRILAKHLCAKPEKSYARFYHRNKWFNELDLMILSFFVVFFSDDIVDDHDNYLYFVLNAFAVVVEFYDFFL